MEKNHLARKKTVYKPGSVLIYTDELVYISRYLFGSPFLPVKNIRKSKNFRVSHKIESPNYERKSQNYSFTTNIYFTILKQHCLHHEASKHLNHCGTCTLAISEFQLFIS